MTVSLLAGKAHDLRVEYFYTGGSSEMRLQWQEPGAKRGAIPAAQFKAPDGSQGLKAEYFATSTLENLYVTRNDPSIDYAPNSAGLFTPPVWTPGPLALDIDVVKGEYRLEWLDPASGGRIGNVELVKHAGGTLTLKIPMLVDDIAARLQIVGAA